MINKNSAAPMTRGTRVTRTTLAVRTTQVSQLAATGTPSLDNKTSMSSEDNNSKIPYYFGGFPKIRGCLLFVLWPWPKQEKLSYFFQMVFVITKMPIRWTGPSLGARCKLAQTLADVIIENNFPVPTIDSSHH
jgi:hypothetical protein